MNVTATEAKNRLAQVLERSQRERVSIGKAGRPYGVVSSSGRDGIPGEVHRTW